MIKGMLLAPSMFGMAVSMSIAVQPPNAGARADGDTLSPAEMRATRGGTNGGTCSIGICNRPDGQPLCQALGDPPSESVRTYYDPGYDCSGGAGSCTAASGYWCEIDKYYSDTTCGQNGGTNYFTTTLYTDRCC